MQFALPAGKPTAATVGKNELKYDGLVIVGLFLMTIMTAVSFHNFLHIPPVFGMMTGLAYLQIFGFYLRRQSKNWSDSTENPPGSADDPYNFDVFDRIAHAEWDTLFFFYGVILSVGGLGFIGYLSLASGFIYGELGATSANIPLMFAVLTMNPEMSHTQWLLITLTAGVGGSLLSIGSAAGVALMGQARGQYTFFNHLKWTPVIALGYGASIWAHLWLNG